MSPLEQRYRRLLLAYPRPYRQAHGEELLDVLLDCSAPGRTVPALKEATGLVAGGLRQRLSAATRGPAWADGLHLGVTALSVLHLAALLPYTRVVPVWTALSALALLAVLRGRVRLALPLILLTGAKAVSLAYGRQLFELTLLPVDADLLTGEALFEMTGPAAVATGYALALSGLLALAAHGGTPRTRSWWWVAAVPLLAWAGPEWMSEESGYPLSLSRIALEVAVLGLAMWAGRRARDLRWAVGAGLYLLAASATLAQHAELLTQQHLAYWGLLAFLTFAAAFVPHGLRRHAVD